MPLLLPGETAPSRRPSPVPAGASSFTFFFRPILRDLWGYWWLDLPLYGKGAGEDASFREAFASVPPDGWVPPGLLMPRFARYLIEDWCDCYGFLEKPRDAGAMQDRSQRGQLRIWEADLGFRNVDGVFWLMHSANERLAETMVKYVGRMPGAELAWEEVELDA